LFRLPTTDDPEQLFLAVGILGATVMPRWWAARSQQ
jgi:Mn2+/Fe2+ NRAMP family transporter